MTRRKTAMDRTTTTSMRVAELEAQCEGLRMERASLKAQMMTACQDLDKLDEQRRMNVALIENIVRELEPAIGKTPGGSVVNSVREVVAVVAALRSQVASLQFPADVDVEIDTPDFSSLADEAPVLRGVSIAALESLRSTIVTSSRDWSGTRGDAWLYGLVVGWGKALPGIGTTFGWSSETIERLNELHEAFADASDDAEIEAG